MAANESPDDTYPEPEAVARREALLKRMLATAPKPMKGRKRSGR